ncbi:hypothetical protein CC99x_008820 [Candidatus Berkiella cookevillensis]|uniref:Right handed beta helix domain-containing protein n=1 Tax=Candidatus Berkiella cookevillensis TaxID=437022 RepID=A0A0Q9YJP9_9GAMM|nr:CSLREA domain-containing protein [Candidatus Berkiella cookevillensis]MCS5709003.1 hypothetical protein [Candidatus Berkiella cookevillensis]
MKKLDSNPFLELEFEELFNIPLTSTQDAKDNNAAPVTEPESIKAPVSNSSSEDIQSIADINVLPSPAAGGAENASSQPVLSDFIQIVINTHASKYGVVESVARDLSVFNKGQEYIPDDYQDLLFSSLSNKTVSDSELENPKNTENPKIPEDPDTCHGDVTTTADIIDAMDGLISLREAIIAANQVSGVTQIHLCDGEYNLSIVGQSEELALKGDLDIHSQIVIIGQSRENTIINANQIDRLFQVMPNASLTLKNITLVGGEVGQFSGGAIFNQGTLTLDNVLLLQNQAKMGGAIYNDNGSITINHSILDDNHATLNGGGIFNFGENATITLLNSELRNNVSTGYAGGLGNQFGIVHINGSTLYHNQASYMGGGVLNMYGEISIDTSTISGNTATLSGGGLANLYGESVDISHSTITDNTSLLFGSGIYSNQSDPSKLTSISMSIIAGNSNDLDMSGIGFESLGYNLIGNTDGTVIQANIGDQFGSLGGISATGHQGVIDPLLDVLTDNGGLTLTHALLPSSPAINAGDVSDSSFDQRGIAVAETKDIGAYETEATIQHFFFFSQAGGAFNPIAPEETGSRTLNNDFLSDMRRLELNEILPDLGHSEHVDVDTHLEKLGVSSSSILNTPNSPLLETIDMSVFTASVGGGELYILESYP